MSKHEPTGPPTPLPYRQLLPLLLVLIAESVSITMLFPFIGYMVLSFGVVKEIGQVGFYAGLIASAFNGAQFFASFVHGHLADTWGRRPVLLLSNFGGFVTMGLFGFSKNLWMAMLIRMLGGAMAGSVGVAKVYISDVTDASNEGKGFALMGLTWGLGNMIGPMFGGVLSNPTDQYPNYFSKGGFLEKFPYFLPCIMSSIFSLAACCIGFFTLKETKVKSDSYDHLPNPDGSPSNRPKGGVQVYKMLLSTRKVVATTVLYGLYCYATIHFDETFMLWAINHPSRHGLGFSVRKLGLFFTSLGCLIIFNAVIVPILISKFRGSLRSFRIANVSAIITILIVPMLAYVGINHAPGASDGSPPAPLPNATHAYLNDTVSTGYGSCAVPPCVNGTQLSHWAILSAIGSPEAAMMLPIDGSPMRVARGKMLPQSASGSNAIDETVTKAFWPTIVLWVVFVYHNLVKGLGFSSVMMMVGNCVDGRYRGAVNGIGQSLASLARMSGPYVGGVAYSWSDRNGLPFPFDFRFSFLLSSLYSAIIVALSYLIKQSDVTRAKEATPASTAYAELDEEEMAEELEEEEKEAEKKNACDIASIA